MANHKKRWFESLTGFEEPTVWGEAKACLKHDPEAGTMTTATGRTLRTGKLELMSLNYFDDVFHGGDCHIREYKADVTDLLRDPACAGDTFMAASQFNLLEHVAPDVGIEAGLTIYDRDHTQGPAVAMATGAATLYRHFFAQTPRKQINTARRFMTLMNHLCTEYAHPDKKPFAYLNGYILVRRSMFYSVAETLRQMMERDELWGSVRAVMEHGGVPDVRGLLETLDVGWHTGAAVTGTEHTVDLALCSAYPVAYNEVPSDLPEWEHICLPILMAQYETTIRLAHAKARAGGSNRVWLTKLGAGAFGNPEGMVYEALGLALAAAGNAGLDIRLVQYAR